MISFKAEVENSPGNAKQLLETQNNEKIYVTLASLENPHSLPQKPPRQKCSMFWSYKGQKGETIYVYGIFFTYGVPDPQGNSIFRPL